MEQMSEIGQITEVVRQTREIGSEAATKERIVAKERDRADRERYLEIA
jgi:hypothetical protein